MGSILRLLLVADTDIDTEPIWREINKLNITYKTLLVSNRVQFLHGLKSFQPDIVIFDSSLSQLNWKTDLILYNNQPLFIPIILLIDSNNEEITDECIKAGIFDYVLKDNLSRLGLVVHNSIVKINLKSEKTIIEEELHESELRLHNTQTIAHIGNWELDLLCKTVWCSKEALSIYGFEKESNGIPLEVVLRSPLPEYRTMLEEALDHLIKHNEPYEIEFKIKRASDESIRTIYSKGEPISTKNKMQVKIIGIIQDITEHKQAEETIDKERRMLRTLIDKLPDIIYVKDFECRKVIANIADVKNIGFEKEEDVLGKTDLELYPGKIGERGYADDLEIINSGKALVGREEDFINSKGVRRWLLTSKFPLYDRVGKIYGLVGIGHDITIRKQSEEELVKAKEKAEESDRLKTAFLHNISHEIRTPLNAIVGFVTLLGEPEVDLKMRQLYIETVMQSSDHLLSIITDIIDISNIEANLIKADRNKINLNSTLNLLYNQFTPRAIAKNISIIVSATLPDYDSFVFSDIAKIKQILSNLIDNAIKFTNQGTIKIGYEIEFKYIKFYVSDSGIGIATEDHEKIFNRFYQIDNTVSRAFEGLGVGLAITKAYVQLLGGKIWVLSQPGNGSTFYFTIPYEKATEAEYPNSENLTFSEPQPEKKLTILVAEDIDSNFRLIKYFLKDKNAEIIKAVNGKEAVEFCLSNTGIDLILMDIKMPIMDGFTATRLIREANITIPIIAQTAYVDDKNAAFECGCSGFITKPFDKKGLLQIINEYI